MGQGQGQWNESECIVILIKMIFRIMPLVFSILSANNLPLLCLLHIFFILKG